MSERPPISVIVPCYNAERYIAATVDSVLAQGWPSIELIVVDDGSTDRSADVIREQYPGVRLVSQLNQGVAAARNRGVQEATADWIAFVDADDIWLPGKLDAQWQVLQAQTEARMCYTAWQVWPSQDAHPAPQLLAELTHVSRDVDRWKGPTGWIYPELLLDCEVWTSTVLMHRRVLDQIGAFDTTLRIGEDYDLWLRASRVTPIVRVAAPYALYRMHPLSITRSAPAQNYRQLVVQRAIDRWGYTSPEGRGADKRIVMRALAKTWQDHAWSQLAAGQGRPALHSAWCAVRTDWRQLGGWKLVLRSLMKNAAQIGTRK